MKTRSKLTIFPANFTLEYRAVNPGLLELSCPVSATRHEELARLWHRTAEIKLRGPVLAYDSATWSREEEGIVRHNTGRRVLTEEEVWEYPLGKLK